MSKSNVLKGYVFTILSAVIFGSMPFMAKYIYTDGVNAISLVLFRNLFAIPIITFLAYKQSKSFVIPKKSLLPTTIIAVIGCCVTPVLLFSSYNFIDSNVATTFHFIYPAMVILLGALFMKQKITFKTLICVLLCVGGISLFYNPNTSIDWRGAALAIISGVTFAIYICLVSAFKYKKIPLFLFSLYIVIISSIILLVFCLATNSLTFPKSFFGLSLCILFANLITAGAVVLLQAGTFLIGGARASILSTLEPIVCIFIGVLFLKENVTPLAGCGAALVILSSVLIAFFDIKNKNKT